MWELDCEEGWAPKNWCFWTVMLEKTLESPLDCKEIQPVYSEGDQLWDFFWRNDAKAEAPVLWTPHAKSWLIGKDSDAGRDWGAGGEGDNRWWDGWMPSPTRWIWVWVNSGIWWWTGRPVMLWFMGLQRVGHDWATELMCPMTTICFEDMGAWPCAWQISAQLSVNSSDRDFSTPEKQKIAKNPPTPVCQNIFNITEVKGSMHLREGAHPWMDPGQF